MTDHDALIASVLATPDDDAPRLVYADWLDEHGQPERAALIRDMIRELGDNEYASQADSRTLRFRDFARQQEFHKTHGRFATAEESADWREVTLRLPDLGLSSGAQIGWCRGFAHSLSLSATDALAHLDAILAAHPVAEVTLTTIPVMRHHSGDVVPDASWVDVLIYLKGRWPTVKAWRSPPVTLQARRLATLVAVPAELLNDSAAPLELPVRPDLSDELDERLSAAPPDSARRRAGHSRMPAWLTEQRGRRHRREGRR